jgi:hypothetical protein
MVNIRPYHTPPGKVDFPFAYVFDATAVPDAQAVRQNNAVVLQGDSEFILRHIAGVNLCVATGANGGRFSYRGAEHRYAQGNPSAGIAFPPNWPVVPEKLWPRDSAIQFDLYQTLRNATVCGETPIYNSYIAFFGVKRFSGSPYRTPYAYYEQKYTYSFDLTINWNHFSTGTTVAPPRRFFVLIDRYDFELMRIAITDTTAGEERGAPAALTTNDFQILAFDANMRAFSNLPLNQFFINEGRPTAATCPTYQPAIAPSIVYPVGSAITFDITSMLCDGVGSPQTYNIAFDGIWRMPKSGRM